MKEGGLDKSNCGGDLENTLFCLIDIVTSIKRYSDKIV